MSHHSDDESESSCSTSSVLTDEETESGSEEEEEEEQPRGRMPVEYTLTKSSASKPAKSQKALLAEAAQTQEPPSWLKKALKPRAKVAVEVEEKRRSQLVQSAEKQTQPEWVEKSRRMSRDVSGLERYIKMKPPDLPPEPEWVGKATKSRDLSVLVRKNNLQTHAANKEAPDWVKEGTFSKKILSAFLQSDAEISPDWMEESRAMSEDEKKQLLSKIEELRQVLEEEQRLTAERKEILAKATAAHESVQEGLNESRSALTALQEGEGGELGGLADKAEAAFEKTANLVEDIKETYGIVVPEQILQLADEARAETEGGEGGVKKHRKKKRSTRGDEGAKRKKKSSKKKKKRDPNETSEEKRARRAARKERKEQRRIAREKKAAAAEETAETTAERGEEEYSGEPGRKVPHTKHSDPQMLESSRDSPLMSKKKRAERKRKEEKEKKKKAK
mmetsp:Transcript_1963/g.7085  ORF Transcript_1963/g.7085 Transcript_1963/m.7085 type:complete len:448 (+) Transcript_1963:57-1400(+)